MNVALKSACGKLCLALAIAGSGVTAHAQSNRTPPVPPARPGVPPQAQPAPSGPSGRNSSEAPGESLSQSQGVIRPPATEDPGVISPPNGGTTPMPEIRPPGTPGGNPNVQPK